MAISSPRDLAKHVLARVSLGYAKAFVALARAHLPTESGAAAYGAICGYYARPFTNNHGFGALSPSFVPADALSVHEQVMRDRHKVFMHSEKDVEIDGTLVNSLEFVSDGKSMTVQNIFVCPTTQWLDQVEDLIDRVRASLNEAIIACLNQGPVGKDSLPAGTYRLNLQYDDRWFIPT